MQIKFRKGIDRGCGSYILRLGPGHPAAIWPERQIRELDNLPLEALDRAARHPGEWQSFEWKKGRTQ